MPLPLAPRLSALSAAAFVGGGVAVPFLPVWLEARGLDAATIGVLLAIPICVRIVATAPLVGLADRGASTRALLVLAHLGTAAAYAFLAVAPGPAAIALVVALAAVAQAPIVPATDLAITDAVREGRGIDYGRVRIWGSISFLAASFGMGAALEALPRDAIVGALVLAGLLGAAVALGAPARGASSRAAPARAPRAALPAPLVLAIAAAATVQATHAVVYAYGSIHWKALGFSGAAVGSLWAVGVIAEIALFVALGRSVGRSAGMGLVAIGGLAAAARFGGLALDPGFPVALALQALHGLSFGATHLGAMAAITRLAPEGARGRAQGALAAVSALGMAAGMAALGPLYAAAQGLVYLAMVPLGLLGAALALAAARADAREARLGRS